MIASARATFMQGTSDKIQMVQLCIMAGSNDIEKLYKALLW
jgi:hypothetical protein